MAEDKPTPTKSPFSEKMLRIVAKVRETESPEERANLLMALAAVFAQEHDPTDEDVDDMYHNFFEEYQRSRLEFQQAAIRLGRLAMSEVSMHLQKHDIPLSTFASKNTATN